MNTQFANYFMSQSMRQLFNLEVKAREKKDVGLLNIPLYEKLALKTANQN